MIELRQKLKRYRVSIAVSLSMQVFYVVPLIPYVNIYNSLIIGVTIAFATAIMVWFDYRQLYSSALKMFLLVLFFTLVHQEGIAETVGNAIYFVLLIAFFLATKKLLQSP